MPSACSAASQAVNHPPRLHSVRLHANFTLLCAQVLSPTKQGSGGTVSLNRWLQPVLNPPSRNSVEMPYFASLKRNEAAGHPMWREGDRVVQTVNNYDKVRIANALLLLLSSKAVSPVVLCAAVFVAGCISLDVPQLTKFLRKMQGNMAWKAGCHVCQV